MCSLGVYRAYNYGKRLPEERRLARAATVRPLEQPRKRNLSNPPRIRTTPSSRRYMMRDPLHKKSRPMNQQSDSPFFGLSTELRCQIYRELLGDYAIYIARLLPKPSSGNGAPGSGYGRFGCIKSKLTLGQLHHHYQIPSEEDRPWPSNYIRQYSLHQSDFAMTALFGGLLGLLKTCRKIYIEAIDLLYSTNRFSFCLNLDIIKFKETILPQRADAITAIQLYYKSDWGIQPLPSRAAVCSLLSSLKGLKTLDIVYEPDRNIHGREVVEKFLVQLISALRHEVSITVLLKSPASPQLVQKLEACSRPNLLIVQQPDGETTQVAAP